VLKANFQFGLTGGAPPLTYIGGRRE